MDIPDAVLAANDSNEKNARTHAKPTHTHSCVGTHYKQTPHAYSAGLTNTRRPTHRHEHLHPFSSYGVLALSRSPHQQAAARNSRT